MKRILFLLLFCVSTVMLYAQPTNNTCAGAIPATFINAQGTGCDVPTTLPFVADGTTASGQTVSCSNAGNDQFFTWTATTDALNFTQLAPGNPGVAIWDAGCTTEIACLATFTDGQLFGWNVGDNLVIQIYDFAGSSSDVAFCLEELASSCNNDLTCDVAAGEFYCVCTSDCPCGYTQANNDVVFISGYETGSFAGSVTPFVYCESQVSTGAIDQIPEMVYIPFAPLAGSPCIPTWDLSTDFGSIFASTDPISPSTDVDDGFIALVGLTDADITASGGTVTVTFDDPNGPCSIPLVIDLSTALNSGDVAWSGTAAAECPGVCGSPEATFVSYDCAAPSVTIEVRNLGTPSAGSTGFTWTLQDATGTVISTIPVTALGNVVIPLPDNTQIYDLVASDGVTPGCDVGFFNNPNFYGDCRMVMAGCTDIIMEGDFETVPPVAWTELSVDNSNTPTPFAIVGPTPALADANGAWLGGYGNAAIGTGAPFTTTISQMMTIPAGTATLYFWAEVPVMQTSHTFTMDVDGTVLLTNADVLPNEDLNWREYSVDLSAFADGAMHTITFNLIEDGTDPDGDGTFQTNIFIDEVILESCSSACPPDYAVGGNGGLTGTEAGTADYETDGSIDSDQTIASTAMVDYDSAIDIDLSPNFEVQLGAIFCAFIDGCNGGAGGVNLTSNEDNSAKAKSGDLSSDIIEMGSRADGRSILKTDKYQRTQEAQVNGEL